MSSFSSNPRKRQLDEIPQGKIIASYRRYEDAMKAVDYLADNKFAVETISIVGNDLKAVERVMGRLTYTRVAISGLMQGVIFGFFVGLLLSFLTPAPEGSIFGFNLLSSVLLGAMFFMIFQVASYTMNRGRRDFASTNQIIASSFDIIVDNIKAAEAAGLLSGLRQGESSRILPNGQDRFSSSNVTGNPRVGDLAASQRSPEDGRDPQELSEDSGGKPGKPLYDDLPDGRPQFGERSEY